MGNTQQELLAQKFKKEKIMSCFNCKERFDLDKKLPIMICSNQHNLCDDCLQQLRPKNCLECREMLWIKRKKNLVLVHLLQMLRDKQDANFLQDLDSLIQHQRKKEGPNPSPYHTLDSPNKRAIKLKTTRQQSVTNLNLELFNEQRQFRKKYSVANIFTTPRLALELQNKDKQPEDTFEDVLSRHAQEDQVPALRQIVQSKKDPQTVDSLDFTLCKLTVIYPFLAKFTSLTRLNLNKNRITRIENLTGLRSLTYLSLSDNHLEFIQNLDELTNLKNLYLNKNKFQQIQNLQQLQGLEFLGLGSNSIQKIERLTQLNELKWLNLELNYITRIEGLSHMKSLQVVLLGSNEITQFEGLENLPALKQIHLQNNKIQNLGPALSMKHLKKLRLDDNPGLREEQDEYVKVLKYIDAKNKGIQNVEEGCLIF